MSYIAEDFTSTGHTSRIFQFYLLHFSRKSKKYSYDISRNSKMFAVVCASLCQFCASCTSQEKWTRKNSKWRECKKTTVQNRSWSVPLSAEDIPSALCCELFFCDSAHRTCSCAGSAANAAICIDLVLSVAGSDSAYRTFSFTGSVANAGIRNNVCHDRILLTVRTCAPR